MIWTKINFTALKNSSASILNNYEKGTFGGGQIINKLNDSLISGSDPRKDGSALSY